MYSHKLTAALLVLIASICMTVAHAQGTVIPFFKSNTHDPTHGYDVSSSQTISVRFSPTNDFTLDKIEVWFMNNSTVTRGIVTFTLQGDKKQGQNASVPDGKILEKWAIQISSSGFDPKEETLFSSEQIELAHDKFYWLVAESCSESGENPIWNVAKLQGDNAAEGYVGSFNRELDQWNSLGYSALPNIRIYGLLPKNPTSPHSD